MYETAFESCFLQASMVVGSSAGGCSRHFFYSIKITSDNHDWADSVISIDHDCHAAIYCDLWQYRDHDCDHDRDHDCGTDLWSSMSSKSSSYSAVLLILVGDWRKKVRDITRALRSFQAAQSPSWSRSYLPKMMATRRFVIM